MRYAWEFDGGAISEFASIDNLNDAKLAVEGILSQWDIDDPVWAEHAEDDGTNEDGEQCWRLLCWPNEADSDSGSNAIGQLTWVGEEEGVSIV